MSRRPRIIVERLGEADAALLSSIVGGTRLRVPMGHRPASRGGRDGFARLVDLVGEKLATLLIFHFADSVIYVPTGAPRATVEIVEVKRLAAKGHSSAKIARALGCSERTVDAKLANIRSRQLANPNKSGKGNGSAP